MLIVDFIHVQVTGIQLGRILQIVSSLIAAVSVGFASSWELTLVLMFAFPLMFFATYLEIRSLSGRAELNKRRLEESGMIAAESINNIDTLASLGIEPLFCSRYRRLLSGPFKYTTNLSRIHNNNGIVYFAGAM